MTTRLSIVVFQKKRSGERKVASAAGSRQEARRNGLWPPPSCGAWTGPLFWKLRGGFPHGCRFVGSALCTHGSNCRRDCVQSQRYLRRLLQRFENGRWNSSASVRMYWKEDVDDSLKTREDDGEKFNPVVPPLGCYTGSRSGLVVIACGCVHCFAFRSGFLGNVSAFVRPDFYPPEFLAHFSQGRSGGGGGGRGTGKIKRRRVS